MRYTAEQFAKTTGRDTQRHGDSQFELFMQRNGKQTFALDKKSGKAKLLSMQ